MTKRIGSQQTERTCDRRRRLLIIDRCNEAARDHALALHRAFLGGGRLASLRRLTTTRYSRSVLINRLFMFNAAPGIQCAVESFRSSQTESARLREAGTANTGTGARNFGNKGMLLHRGEATPETSRKKSRETAEPSRPGYWAGPFTGCLEDDGRPDTGFFHAHAHVRARKHIRTRTVETLDSR